MGQNQLAADCMELESSLKAVLDKLTKEMEIKRSGKRDQIAIFSQYLGAAVKYREPSSMCVQLL